MSKLENNCLLGICSLDDFISAVVVISILIGVLWICRRILNNIIPPEENTVKKIFNNKYVAKTIVGKGGNMTNNETDCKSTVQLTDSPKYAEVPVGSLFEGTLRRRVTNDSNGNVPNKAETIDRFLIEGGHFCFKICQLGGEVELPFCTAHFPEHAVKELKTLRFFPIPKDESDLKLLVRPIHCSTLNQNGAILFNRFVKFKIKIEQRFYQILQDTEEAELQITECSVNINWITQKKITIKKADGFISFAIMRFAGFRVMRGNLPLADKSALFFAICLKRPGGISDPSQLRLLILIHSAEDSMKAEAKNTFASENVKILLHQQSILVRSSCQLEVSVTNENFDSKPVFFEIESSCQDLLKKEHMDLSKKKKKKNSKPKKNSIPSHEEISLYYTVSVLDDLNPKVVQGWVSVEAGEAPVRTASAPGRFAINISDNICTHG